MDKTITPNIHWEHSKKDINETFPKYYSLIEKNELAIKTIALVSMHRFLSVATINIMKHGTPTHDKQDIVNYLDGFADDIEKELGIDLDREEKGENHTPSDN